MKLGNLTADEILEGNSPEEKWILNDWVQIGFAGMRFEHRMEPRETLRPVSETITRSEDRTHAWTASKTVALPTWLLPSICLGAPLSPLTTSVEVTSRTSYIPHADRNFT